MKKEKVFSPIMTFCELRDKEVINVLTGKRLGFINDIELDVSCGRITRILLPPPNKYFSIFTAKECICIPWENVEKIGSDTILVRYYEPCQVSPDKPC